MSCSRFYDAGKSVVGDPDLGQIFASLIGKYFEIKNRNDKYRVSHSTVFLQKAQIHKNQIVWKLPWRGGGDQKPNYVAEFPQS